MGDWRRRPPVRLGYPGRRRLDPRHPPRARARHQLDRHRRRCRGARRPAMSTGGVGERPRRGRPRSERAQKAILAAAIELLLEQGLHAMSMDDVAKRAGVSKATIYRWWTSKELLALDALATEWAPAAPAAERDTGTLCGDLLARFRPWLRQLNQKPFGRVIAGLVAEAQTDPEFARLYRQHFVQP